MATKIINPFSLDFVIFLTNVQNSNPKTTEKETKQIVKNAKFDFLKYVFENQNDIEFRHDGKFVIQLIAEELDSRKVAINASPELSKIKTQFEPWSERDSRYVIPDNRIDAQVSLEKQDLKQRIQREAKRVSQETNGQLRPGYYGGEENPFEPIKIIRHYNLSFEAGNAIKYILRAGVKDKSKHIEDLRKTLTYIQFEITRVEELIKKEI